MTRRKSGFTLIELLVVIAIIAILAAILFPVFVSAKERGKCGQCQGHMRQIGSALLLYLQDNGDRMPYQADQMKPPDALGAGMNTPNWAGGLLKYTKTRKIFKCPSSISRVMQKDNPPIPEIIPTSNTQISYMFNGIAAGKLVSVCNHASKTALFREIQYYYGVGWLRPQPDGQGSYDAWYQMHFDGCNFVFADGHLKFVKLHQVPANSNNKFWNFDDQVYKIN